ncbi:polyprenyl synthetase family protein [Neobacillus dielmonensis]|uniref:polyprenyl synthetase family protein n=1 Tax=Neobacillus dielmonensis TaxID=1347369 RepID=UPI0005A956C5|nr:polyprenyl synthetase family protein [Neobacillus dielmonensis]
MNEESRKHAEAGYCLAEEKAAAYFQAIHDLVLKKQYVSTLINDIEVWKKNHIHHPFSKFFPKRRNPNSANYQKYIQWLDYSGKLDSYLERSISYIFLRDLGKALDNPGIWMEINSTVDGLKKHLIANRENQIEPFSIAALYRWSQKEGVETAIIWLLDKLKKVAVHIPDEMDSEHALRKLIKIIGGVVMNVLDEIEEGISKEERAERLDKAIRLGYSYGLTYPFIDDLLDANVLTETEKKQYSNMIRHTLITGTAQKLGEWDGKNINFIQFVHHELCEAFEYIKANQREETSKLFFEHAFVFFQSQELDRNKDLSEANYSNEDLFIPIILKSSSSRLIVRSVINAPEDENVYRHTFYYGIYNQLADDFADMFEDQKEGRVTPYTYYIQHHKNRPDLINPFELYWAVICHLIHNVYHADSKATEVILDRAINGLKRFKERHETRTYNEAMGLFASRVPRLNRLIQQMVRKAEDVEFFDKLLRDHIILILKNERKEKEDFIETAETLRNQINTFLSVPPNKGTLLIDMPIIEAANYSLKGNGKRLRPIITWVIGVKGYGLDESAIVPLLKSLEYMHTASLIFDDLPSQDNAPFRRGRPTLHQVYNSAIAELTGLFLMQKATEEQASIYGFEPQSILRLIHYSARVTGEICMGQTMDLESKGKPLTLEQLDELSFYKTGLAFEASLVMPAILAQASETEMKDLKKFARHAGIAFQIKDDLLDVEGEHSLLGKPVGMDAENNQSTFVSILGKEDARKAMWDHYCSAVEALQEVPRNTTFLKQLMHYMINREH